MYLSFFFSLVFAFSFLGALEWSSPVTLSNPAQNAKNPVLSVDYATGHAIAAWIVQSGGHTVIDASIFDGNSWSEPVTISDSESNSDQPSVSINQDGHALVIWRSALTSTTNGISASFFNGMAWSAPASIGGTLTSDTPQVALHPMLDTALAVWKKSRGIAGLQTAFFDGMDWTLVPGFEPSSVIGKFSLCMNLAGTALLNWIQSTSNSPLQTAVFGAVFEGGWSTAAQLSLTGETPINTDAAIYLNADRGGALWTNLTSIRSSYWDDLQWLNAEIAANSLSSAVYPKLTFSPTFPNMAGIWQSSEGIQGALYINGKWSAYQTLATAGKDPALAFHPSDGAVYAVWRTNRAIETASFNAASHSVVAPLSSLGSSLSPPDIHIDTNGAALAIWSILLGETTVVQIARGS